MTIAESIADKFVAGLDLNHMSRTQSLILHGIKSVAMNRWAKRELDKFHKGGK